MNPFNRITHIMFDLEALGVSADSVVLSIGAVAFNANGIYGPEFYREILPQEDRNIDISTLKWWLEQPIPIPINGTIQLDTVMREFNSWVNTIRSITSFPDMCLWANGIDFDWGVLKDISQKYVINLPVKYDQVRDYRTLKKLFPAVKFGIDSVVKHNALDDARWQALHCVELLKHVAVYQPIPI
jgi:hypothetical protein